MGKMGLGVREKRAQKRESPLMYRKNGSVTYWQNGVREIKIKSNNKMHLVRIGELSRISCTVEVIDHIFN